MPAPRIISYNPISGETTVVTPERKATRDDWKTCDMPAMSIVASFRLHLTPERMDNLSWGHIPQEMEDMWFSYMDGNHLFLHRSWTGFCIYAVTFGDGDVHTVRINRDPEQYGSTDLQKDLEMLGALIGRFSSSEDRPYDAWLGDTVEALRLDDGGSENL